MQAIDLKATISKLLSEIRSLPPGPKALEKLAYLREHIDSNVDGYMNALNIFGDTAYEDRKHFLLELIQNADDAKFVSLEGELKFVIHDDSLELFYNEKGFTVEDVIAITGTGSSTKASKKQDSTSFIGEKGIGFKSVFALATDIEIESYPWHFRLHKNTMIVPEVLYSGQMGQGDGTRLLIRFDSPASVNLVATELQRFVKGQVETFLFLQRLSRLIVEDRRNNRSVTGSLSVFPTTRNSDSIELVVSPENESRSYALYGEDIEFPSKLVVKRWGGKAGDRPLTRRLVAAANINPLQNSEGRLFCFLPTEVKLPVPIYLQVDGHTKADRERLHDLNENEWNKHLLSHLPKFIVGAIENWRQHPILSDNLYHYIPIDKGSDQLGGVFQTVITILRSSNWVRTFDDAGEAGWVQPQHAVMANDFLEGWFQRIPGFRRRVEEFLKKKFVSPEWRKQAKWKKVAVAYNIHEINGTQFASILRSVQLPPEMIQRDENLVELYQRLITLFSGVQTSQAEIRSHLLKSPIYPLDGGGFGKLLPDDGTKIYYLKTGSKRSAEMGTDMNVQVVDPNYTYSHLETKDASLEKRAEDKRIIARNATVRQLLEKLQVKVLDDVTLLADLQIPYLLSTKQWKDPIRRYRILESIFNAYRVKRSRDSEYLRVLSKLNEALFEGESGKFVKVSQLLLPKTLQTVPGDRVFEQSGLDILKLPSGFGSSDKASQEQQEQELTGTDSWRKALRQFLIHCGICIRPKFTEFKKAYYPQNLRYSKPAFYNSWSKRVGKYSDNNQVIVEYYELDPLSKELLKYGKCDRALMADSIYEGWTEYFAGQSGAFNIQTQYYNARPPLGYFRADYKYYQDYGVLIRNEDWATANRRLIPLRTVNGEAVVAAEALRSTGIKKSGLLKAASYLPIVLENEEGGYDSKYLDCLEVPTLSASDINALWKNASLESYDEILEVLIELGKAGFTTAGLHLYDKQAKRTRPISEFRLGQGVRKEIPLIEEQYGERGRVLGKMLGLDVESETVHFAGVLQRICSDDSDLTQLEQCYLEIYRLLKNWKGWSKRNRSEMISRFQQVRNASGYESEIILVINDKKMLSALKDAGEKVIGFKAPDTEKYELEEAGKELGLELLVETGVLQVESERMLESLEISMVDHLMNNYLNALEEREKPRAIATLSKFCEVGSWSNGMRKVNGAYRIKGGVRIPLPIPFLDQSENKLLLSMTAKPVEMAARLIALSELSTYNGATAELKEILKTKPRPLLAQDMEQPIPPVKVGLDEIAEQVRAKFQDGRPTPGKVDRQLEWKGAMPPEQEDEYRDKIRKQEEESLKAGFQLREVTTRKPTRLHRKFKWIDTGASKSREFLLAEYGGKCQICATELRIWNGKKLFHVYHIHERRNQEAVWADRVVNILCLCPNCHALAKHGGGLDFGGIGTLVDERDAFPVELPKYNGDFYEIMVRHNGELKRMVISSRHLVWISAYLGKQEVSASTEGHE